MSSFLVINASFWAFGHFFNSRSLFIASDLELYISECTRLQVAKYLMYFADLLLLA